MCEILIRRKTHTWVLLERATQRLPPGHGSHSPHSVGSIPELIQLNPLQARKTASTILSRCVFHPDGPNAFPSLVSSLSQTLPSGYEHTSTVSWKAGAGFSLWPQELLFAAPQEEVHRQKNCPCVLLVSKFSFLLFQLQAGNRGLGHSGIFSLQGGQKKWMLPSGDMLLYFILEKKKKSISFFYYKTVQRNFPDLCLASCLWPWFQINFHIKPVAWLYASSRCCSVCLHWDRFYIEEISLKSKPHRNERRMGIVLQWTAPLVHQSENLCVIFSGCISGIFTCCFTSVCQCYKSPASSGGSSSVSAPCQAARPSSLGH